MSAILSQHRRYLSHEGYARSFFFSIFLFILALVANYAAGIYATVRASNYVTDIILSNIPVVDVDGLFVWGTMILIGFVILLCLADARRIPFTLYSLAMFYIVRAVFVSLTHLGAYPDHTIINEGAIMNKMFGGDDLFFSGHTGAPFMLALVYWREELLRYVFLSWSVFMACVVLLGHLHYSIDVLSAYFITCTIFTLTERYFPKDRQRFYESEAGA